ncbi:MAG TPA: tRNA pseudouridine(13) synthase TruD [Polyangiaceae bacterium]|nr:tRNA pseudouridine(13) synthase TruD [Polyangiaceae bacterium]
MTSEPESFTAPAPHTPPLMFEDLPAIEAKIGETPEDFVVDEIPLYAQSGAGEHLYVRVEKRGYTTPAMVRAVSRAAGVDERDVGYAGLKDKHAVTRQWLSLPAKARPPSEWQLPEGIAVIEHARHSNKLRTGHLLGNRFRITLVTPDLGALEKATPLAERLRARGLFNYYGGQRFGRKGDGLGQALAWLRGGAKLHGLPRFLTKLYPSVIQAEVYNRYFTARRALGLERLLLGEVVRLNNAGAMFTVEDTAREGPRLESGDIHLTGPIFGPKARPSTADAAALERAQLAELGLDPAALDKLARLAPGARRDLIAKVSDLELRWAGVGRLELEFSLPSGSYATEVIRQFTQASFLVEEADRGSDS